jgi:hypothetical protein
VYKAAPDIDTAKIPEKEMKGSPKKRMRCPNTDSSKAARMILKEYILGG